MIANKTMDQDLLTVLPEIYYYGIKGENAFSPTDHIIENEANIQKWVQTIHRAKDKLIS